MALIMEMSRLLLVLVGSLALLLRIASGLEAEAKEALGCILTVATCRNFPEFTRTQFRDTAGEEHSKTGTNEAACLKRAEDMHYFCGNGAKEGAQVAATFSAQQLSQVYHPGACEKGWSQWDAFCYKHYWEKRTWFEAEALCRQRGGHLVSVHSQAENRFVFTLTSGLSAWIGYTDIDQDTHYQWSDSTQDDFSNHAKNCTGRETEPDCQPEEKAQQWYDWEGNDRGTFVCKRNALLPVALLRNTSAQAMKETDWLVLLPGLKAGTLPVAEGTESATAGAPAAPALKAPEIPSAKETVQPSSVKPPVPEPKLMVPKGSLL
jgi:hypothetical protein